LKLILKIISHRAEGRFSLAPDARAVCTVGEVRVRKSPSTALRSRLPAHGVDSLQFILFYMLYGTKKMEIALYLLNLLLFLALLIASMVVHELIHGLTWMWFGKSRGTPGTS
jgi:hypothetical protein